VRLFTGYQRGSIFGAIIVFVAFAAALSTVPRAVDNPLAEKRYTATENPHPSHHEEETWWQWATTDPIAAFTLLLAVVAVGQALLFVWQLVYMRRGIDEAGIAANAAKDAAKAAVELNEISSREFNATHRPHLIMRDVCLDGNDILYLLINKGDAEATIVESWIMVEYVPKNKSLRPLRSYGHDCLGQLHFAVGQMIDRTYTPREPLNFFSSMELDFVGTIVYADRENQRRRTVFRRRWDVDTQGFRRLINDPDQEYSD
jgi:hypothetical protein